MRISIQAWLLLAASLLFCTTGAFAQDEEGKGIISGKVVEAESGFMIIGASVFIGELGIGTVSDLDGNFQLREVPTGTYTVECSYLGYAKAKVEGVEIKDGKVVNIDYALEEEALALEEEVVIEARQVRNTETSLLTLKRQAASVLDGISAATIKKTGDRDAASAMRRITGVTVEGGKYIYVRGLGDRYSKTTLNGAEVPGLDPNRNTVQMDLFPTNLLDNILVYKSFTPDLYGDFTGGYVDIATKDFPDVFTINASASMSYNTISTFNPNIASYQGGSMDWLGFDDGSRAKPDGIPAQQDFPFYQPSTNTTFDPAEAQQLEGIVNSFPNRWGVDSMARPFNHNLAVSLGTRTKLFGKDFGFVAALTYQRSFNGYENGRYSIFELPGTTTGFSTLEPQLVLSENVGENNVLWGAMFSSSLKLNETNKIGLTVLRNQSATSTARYSFGTKFRDDPDDQFITQSFRFLQRSLTTAQLRGKHVSKKLNDFEVKWQGAYSASTQDDPDLRFFTFRIEPSGERDIKTSDNPPSRFYRDMQQANITGRIDLTQPFQQWNDLTAKLKIGGAYVYKNRDFNEDRYVYATNGNIPFSDTENYFNEENVVGFNEAEGAWANNGAGIYVEPGVDLQNSYVADQNVLGVYAMVDLPIFKKLRFIGGLRMEQTALTLTSDDPDLRTDPVLPLNGETKLLDNLDFLPAVSFNYEINDKMKLRAAYSRTLARPTFRELAPYTNFDVDGGYLLAGNPTLERTLTDNFDLRYEFYPTFAELVSIGGFYKDFQNPIERTINPIAANTEITFRNVERAYLFGGEFEIRKNLGFIADFMKNFSLAGNVAYIYSQTDIDSAELNQILISNPDADETRAMFGQSPYSINVLLSYQNEKGTQANIVFNVIGPRISVVGRSATPNFFERPVPSLNFNISQEFAEHFKATFRVRNILFSEYRESAFYNDAEYIIQSRPLGMGISLGISYQFKGKGGQ